MQILLSAAPMGLPTPAASAQRLLGWWPRFQPLLHLHVASLCGTSNLLSLSCRDIGDAFRAKQLIQDHLRSLTNSHLLNHISPIWRKVTFTGSRDQDIETAPTTGEVSVTEPLCPSIPGSDQQRPFFPDLQHRNHWKDIGGVQFLRGTGEAGSECGTKAGGQKPAKVQTREQIG